MAHQVKVLSATADDLSSIPELTWRGGELPQLSSHLHKDTAAHQHTHSGSWIEKNTQIMIKAMNLD